MNNNRSSKNRRRRSPVPVFLIGVVALFALVGAVVLIVTSVRSCRKAANKRSLPFRADAEHCYTGDGFMYLDGHLLNFLSLSDENKNFSRQVDSTGVKLAGTDKLKVIYGASSLQVIDTPFDNVIDGTIKKLVCGSKYVGAYVENADHTFSLRVFNSAGTQVYRKDSSGTVMLDFGFEGGDSAALWMSELVTIGSSISTTITTYDLNRESITGVISVQGQAVKQLFITKKSVFAYCTDSLIRFDRGTNDEAYRIRCRGYECLDHSTAGGRLYLLLEHSDAENAPLVVLSLREDATADDSSITLTDVSDSLGVYLMGGRAVIVRTDRLDICSQKGAVGSSVPFDSPITGAEKLDETGLLVIRGTEALLYTLK